VDTRRVNLTRGTWVGLGVTAACVVAAESLAGGAGRPVHVASGVVLASVVVLARVRPAAGLVVMCAVEAIAAVAGVPLVADALVMGLVMYLCARHGSAATLWASGVLTPLAYVLTGAFLANPATDAVQRAEQAGLAAAPTTLVTLALAVAAPLALPWLLGAGLRWRDRAERDRAALLRAEVETAASQQRTRLAHDVHDVVGHSLAVIVAQADSVRYLDATTPPEVQRILDTIADSARSSLTEVRHVLTEDASARRDTDLDGLIDAFPSGAGTVRDRVVGVARPLPPDTAAVAHRVLQEMLTNVMKHGDGGTVEVMRDWRDGLRVAVTNGVRPGVEPSPSGLGLASLRQRVTAAHGTLEVHRDSARFTVEARLPLRGGQA
jgi:signal transduction histidine kinase